MLYFLIIISIIILFILFIFYRLKTVKISAEEIIKREAEFYTIFPVDIVMYKIFGNLYMKLRKKYEDTFEEIYSHWSSFVFIKVIPLLLVSIILCLTLVVILKNYTIYENKIFEIAEDFKPIFPTFKNSSDDSDDLEELVESKRNLQVKYNIKRTIVAEAKARYGEAYLIKLALLRRNYIKKWGVKQWDKVFGWQVKDIDFSQFDDEFKYEDIKEKNKEMMYNKKTEKNIK